MSMRDLPQSPQESAEYWSLVNQLMQKGWYRTGPGTDWDHGRRVWGFSEGHTIDPRQHNRSIPLRIPANSEVEAMRLVLQQLEARDQATVR